MSQEKQMEAMLTQLRRTLSARVMAGNFDYQADRDTLNRYLDSAQKLKSKPLTAQIYNTLGILHHQACYPSLAIGAWQRTLSIYEEEGGSDINEIGTNYNIALALQTLDRHGNALEIFNRILEKAINTPGLIQSSGYIILMIVSDFVRSHLALGNLYDAIAVNDTLNDMDNYISITYNQSYTRALVRLWLATTELAMQRGEFEEAWSSARLGFEQATALNDHSMKTLLAFAQVHLAEQSPTTDKSPASCTELARAQLNAVIAPTLRGRLLLEEGHYRHRTGRTDMAQEHFREARDIFVENDADEGLLLAEQML